MHLFPLYLLKTQFKEPVPTFHISLESNGSRVFWTGVSLPLVEPPNLPTDLANELAAMHLLSDDALQAMAHPSLLSS